MAIPGARSGVLRLARLAGLAGLAGLARRAGSSVGVAAAATAAGDLLVYMEVDTIYPRNESYAYNASSPVIPIAFQVQNVSRPAALGDLQFRWAVNVYADGASAGLTVDGGDLFVPDDVPDGGSAILVSYIDPLNQWQYKPDDSDSFLLRLWASWANLPEDDSADSCRTNIYCGAGRYCGIDNHSLSGIEFGLQNMPDTLPDAATANASAVAQDITRAPACPAFGGLLAAYANGNATTNGTCPLAATINLQPADGAPCAAPVDAAARASILAAASSQAYAATYVASSAAATATTTTSATATATASQAGGAAGLAGTPLGPALAAAVVGVACGLL